MTQKADDLLQLPEGVAFSLEKNQMIRIELHYINTTQSKVDVEATTTFTTLADQFFKHEADFLFIGNIDISIPPNAEATLGPTYFPIPSEFADKNFFAITGHTHRFGTNVRVATASDEQTEVESVYDLPDFTWSEPETVSHNPPFQLPADGGFRFTCEWKNTSSQQIGFGESANKEMCFFWAYYYPSVGSRVCIHTERFGGQDVCCPGDSRCALVDTILD